MPVLLYVFAAGACLAVDGDTLRCGDERVRLARINSVERGETGYREAKDAMRLLIEGKEVRCVVKRREKYGRLLGECGTKDAPSLSDAMLESGLAEPYRGRR